MYDEHESGDQAFPEKLTALEKQLAALTPAALRVDRDRLMFAAGQASVGDSAGPTWAASNLWPAATLLATAASVVLATILVWQRTESGSSTAPNVAVLGDVEPSGVKSDAWYWSDHTPSGYLGVRQVALTRGVGALDYQLPTVDRSDMEEWSPPATAGQLREELLPTSKQSSS